MRCPSPFTYIHPVDSDWGGKYPMDAALSRTSLVAITLLLTILSTSYALDAPLLAQWEFDQEGNPKGVHGNALHLYGKHSHAVDIAPKLGELEQVSLCAWVRPTDLSGYREIFRQECDDRLLFSFQHGGTILSFGLNAGGYVECETTIAPEPLLDGQWHHCAATYDGEVMRLYLDGTQIASLERSAPMRLSKTVTPYIGSLAGQSEHFHGALDDLRIYSAALTHEDVAALYVEGQSSVSEFARELETEVKAIYPEGLPFAETLTRTHQALSEKGQQFSGELPFALSAKLAKNFPTESKAFTQQVGIAPIDYLISNNSGLHEELAIRLVALLSEYKPLTEAQRAASSPEDIRQWQEVDAIEQRLAALVARGETAVYAPEWIEALLEAGARVAHRPAVSEAVAPYRTPSTPETRTLTESEARVVLERDWLHQTDNTPTPERIRDEIRWTRQLAARIHGVDFTEELNQLAALEEQTMTDRDRYFAVRAIKRRIMFRNPAVDFERLLFVDMPYPDGSEWRHETRHRLGYMAVPGARLLILNGLSPDGILTQLMPQAPMHGSFWRPDLSYDGTRVLFCFKPHNEKAFHLYEINVDGTGLTQLTYGNYDDLDPVYLPDGHILFSSTRGHTYVRCMPPTNAFPLARCDADGKNIYLLSRANEPDYLASVMQDGRVIYTRWEYTDKPLWRAQSLWTMHPDGTQVGTLWGNQSVWPDLLKDARDIPGSHRVMFTGSAHHDWFAGSVGIIDPSKGFNFPDGLTKVTADVEWPESGNGPVDPVESKNYHSSGAYKGYYSPYPLSEADFLVSADRDGKFVLYLMDVNGNRELIYEGVQNIFHAIPIKARVKPPVIADQVDWPTREERMNPKGGVIFSSNVYQGAPPELHGKAKFLRILSIEHKTYTYWHKRPYLSTGPVVSGVQSEGVKRVLGTAPIEPDGSVSFYAPSGVPLHFQLLDENYRALQTMRSFTGVMPGERRGCTGCHERHSTAPETPISAMALQRDPDPISPPPWGEDSVSWDRYVRPALDQYCAACHEGDGQAREILDMTPRPGNLGFDETYWLFTGQPAWGQAYQMPENPPPGFGIAGMIMVEGYDQRDPAGYVTPPPMTQLSYKSKLIEIAGSGLHNGVKVDPESLQKLILWVDAMCPYRGAEEVRAIPDPEFQGIEWLAIRPQIQNAPRIVRPGPVDVEG